MSSPQQIKTTVTDLLKIKHPVMLAGMNVAAGPKLAAAVTNAGGLGVIGGVRLVPPSHSMPVIWLSNTMLTIRFTGRLHTRHAPRTNQRTQVLPQR